MAELVLSALLQVLFEKLADAALKSIARYKGIDAEIKKLKRSLLQIQGVLNHAARKEITNDAVKRWLKDLQHLAYDIDDVLDDLATEAMHREFTHESQPITSKVLKLIPSCCTNFSSSTMMLGKLDAISAKLEDLVKEKTDLGLKMEEENRPINRNRKSQTSMVDESSIVGRQTEKEALVHKLLRVEPSHDQKFSIVPIVGMGGVGKTTLARLLYDEEKVKDHFQLKAWVCVSDEFDSFAISKVIFQSVTGENKDFADLNLLQVALRDHLREKRFLFVLDDVWSESYEDWETLVSPFHACAPGSKIIMTTRKDQLLRKLGYDDLSQLERLSCEDALSLIALHALGVNSFDSHLPLKSHALGIVKKCDGLPLALKAIGRLLTTKKKHEEYWKKVLDSDIWNLPVKEEIIPALKLSYHDLTARLKQLFAYCSLFPKDCVFDKEELVLIWMGEGFLHQSPPSDAKEENMGHEYFDELLSRSFFQHAPNNKSLFVMHDMMNDLATYVASEFFVRLDNEAPKDIVKEMLEKYRHMSFVRDKYVSYKRFETFKGAKSLRTLISTSVGVVEWWQSFYVSNKVIVDLIPRLPLLRVLSLCNFNISEVPESIGTLKHLRYLNLSKTEITRLPENVCNLYNLQTLIVAGCYSLKKLPNNFLKLQKMRHLDLRDTPMLKKLPLGIDELKSLQTLSKIIIGGESRFEISKLKYLENLCGKISIMGLENVKTAIEVRDTNFSQKRLSELEVMWSDVLDDPRNKMLEKDVLNELKPSSDTLMQLKIRSYGGLELPNWVGDPSFLRLNHMSIVGCKRCASLPPLGQLPLLKELFIECLDEVKAIGLELLGTDGVFPSLEILGFSKMKGWEKWSTSKGVVFPCLKQLFIKKCPNLVEVTLGALPSLNDVELNLCDSGVLRRLVEVAPALTMLTIKGISGLNDVGWRGVIEYLGEIKDLHIEDCNGIRYLWESEAAASKFLVNLMSLKVRSCVDLMSLGEKEEADNCRSSLLTSLKTLKVSFCNNMERLTCPYNLETLDVSYCKSVTSISLPAGEQKLKSLQICGCEKLLEREWGGKNTNNWRLEYVEIYGWPNLKSITELSYLIHLTSLSIGTCESLESFPDNELSSLTSLRILAIVDCPSMDPCFPRGVWPPNLRSLRIGKLKKPISEWGPQNFPTSLAYLRLEGDEEDGVSSCTQLSHLLPSSLTDLFIFEFEKLESVSKELQHLTSLQHLSFNFCTNLNTLSHLQHLTSLQVLNFLFCPNLNTLSDPQHLTSLQHLTFLGCPKMTDLPEELFPSLLSLQIVGDCTELKERYSKGGVYWPRICHIPFIDMTY